MTLKFFGESNTVWSIRYMVEQDWCIRHRRDYLGESALEITCIVGHHFSNKNLSYTIILPKEEAQMVAYER